MIVYNGASFCDTVLRLKGSVLPHALVASTPSTLLAIILKELEVRGTLGSWVTMGISSGASGTIYGSFMFFLCFLVVFRTSQAYNRYWSAVNSVSDMCAEWYETASMLIAFVRCAPHDHSEGARQASLHMLVRLFSLMSACGLQSLGQLKQSVEDMALDSDAIEEDSRRALVDSDRKAEVVFHWIQQLIFKDFVIGPLKMPPPLVGTAFSRLSSGMARYQDADRLSYVPFPFPYAQTIALLLFVHGIMCPLFMVSVTSWPSVTGFMTLLQVFTVYTLDQVAIEIELPFNGDANDIDLYEVQTIMNHRLFMLTDPAVEKVPSLVISQSTESLQSRLNNGVSSCEFEAYGRSNSTTALCSVVPDGGMADADAARRARAKLPGYGCSTIIHATADAARRAHAKLPAPLRGGHAASGSRCDASHVQHHHGSAGSPPDGLLDGLPAAAPGGQPPPVPCSILPIAPTSPTPPDGQGRRHVPTLPLPSRQLAQGSLSGVPRPTLPADIADLTSIILPTEPGQQPQQRSTVTLEAQERRRL